MVGDRGLDGTGTIIAGHQHRHHQPFRLPATGGIQARNACMSAAAGINPAPPQIRTLYVNSPGGGRLPAGACIHL
jgi:hypothetical protein